MSRITRAWAELSVGELELGRSDQLVKGLQYGVKFKLYPVGNKMDS